MIFPQIKTERLFLRTLIPEDAEGVADHFSDIEVSRFVDIGPDETAEEIIEFHAQDSGCRWGVFLKHENKLIGTCGFHCWNENVEPEAEVGFDLTKAYWGKGFMKEAMIPVIKFGCSVMGLSIICANVHVDNVNSQIFVAKLGFLSDGRVIDNHQKFLLSTNEFSKQ